MVADQAEAGVFKVTRLQLYFANQRAETVIDKNDSGLKAYADITFEGTGLLQGFWEVDGRILASVNRHIGSDMAKLTLSTPDVPGIPTFESGAHRLRLVVTSPALASILPEAIYFVAGKPFESLPLKTLSPAPGGLLPFAPAIFNWEGREGAASYLITFFGADEKPVFSAYTRDSDYQLVPAILENSFSPGREYLWKVVSYGAEQNQLGASRMTKFKFKD
jgi:hypothetical protein